MEKQDVLESSTQRTKGVDALNSNIEASKALSEILKTTLGPMGRDKMLIDSTGNTVITNDGVKILKEMEIEHPGAQLLVEVAKTQETQIGDGTTSAVILTGELLNQAQQLLNKGIHPTQISKLFKQATEKTLEELKDLSIEISSSKKKAIKDLAATAMTGKLAESSKEQLSQLLLQCAESLEYSIEKNSISLVKATGSSIEKSQFVKGVILDKKRAHPNMPDKIKNPKILLIQSPLEIQELENNASVSISNAKEYEEFLAAEKQYLEHLSEAISNSGANVVISQQGIDDTLASYLAQKGIIAIRRVKKSDMEKLSKALNTPIISIDDPFPEKLAQSGEINVKNINNEEYIFIENCPNPKSLSLLLRASTKQTLDELERAFEDALGVVQTGLESKKIVAGGGATELELHKKIQEYAKKHPGKDQLIIQKYAKALLSIPNTLCENAGLEKIETISTLISNHENNLNNSGLSGEEVVKNTIQNAIIEPETLKYQAIKSATETATMILRIDDIIAAKQIEYDKTYEE